MIMFSYTFINGECPITYGTKKIMDLTYIAGKDLNYYPEMLCFFSTDKNIERYFITTTAAYITTLFYVIKRSQIPLYCFLAPCVSLLCYFSHVFSLRFAEMLKVVKTSTALAPNGVNMLMKDTDHRFVVMQEITKYITLAMIIFLAYQQYKIKI